MKIEKIRARQVLDSRGNPTVEAIVETKKGSAKAIVPSGASTGKYEALELRDSGKHWHGKGVSKAVENVNKVIARRLKGFSVQDQRDIDEEMLEIDGTQDKRKLGANAILSVSLACARLAAYEKGMELYEYISKLSGRKKIMPVPFANVLNGGKHAGNALQFQEFMIAPVKAKTFSEGVMIVSEVYHELKQILEKRYGKIAVNVGDEGGFAPSIRTPNEALSLLNKAVHELGYEKKVKFAMDAAASEFYRNKYYFPRTGPLNTAMSTKNMVDYYQWLLKRYPIISIEDPFDQDDFRGFFKLSEALGKRSKVQIVGDDLLVTNVHRIRMALKQQLCNALLLKVNQIGTLTEAIEAAKLAFDNRWNVMVSHRSGETEDTFIADLAVGLGAGQIKLGAPCRGERTAKYNRLLRIEDSVRRYAKWY